MRELMKVTREKMTAAVLYGKRDVRIEQIPIPRVEAGEVLVRIKAALTCGTDLKVYRQGFHARMIVPPAVFGHELAGVVEEVGEGVESFSPGMRVVSANSGPCNECFFCERHLANLCENLQFINGAYAEFIKDSRIHSPPESSDSAGQCQIPRSGPGRTSCLRTPRRRKNRD